MRAVVTGAAGFVGSHLCELLLDRGDEVRAVDCFTRYYERERKEANLAALRDRAGFEISEVDLAEADLDPILEGAEVVYHLAGQPGVRPSWGREFANYVHHNILRPRRSWRPVRLEASGRSSTPPVPRSTATPRPIQPPRRCAPNPYPRTA